MEGKLTGIMATGEVVGSVFFAADELLRVEELAVGSGPHLVDDGGFKIHEDGAWHVLSGAGFAEERVEGVVSSTHGLVTWHLSIRLKKTNTKITDSEKIPKTLDLKSIAERNPSFLPECRVRGSRAPSRHFRPGYRPDRCGSKCTLSFSRENRRKKRNPRRKKRKEGSKRRVF